jgi:hypothetical protein
MATAEPERRKKMNARRDWERNGEIRFGAEEVPLLSSGDDAWYRMLAIIRQTHVDE